MTLLERYTEIVDALGEALQPTQLRVIRDLAAAVDRHDVVVGPPTFLFETLCSPFEPSSVTYTVYLIEAADPRAVERLLDVLPDLLEAVDSLGTVRECRPGAYPAGSSDLPCYMITAETTL